MGTFIKSLQDPRFRYREWQFSRAPARRLNATGPWAGPCLAHSWPLRLSRLRV